MKRINTQLCLLLLVTALVRLAYLWVVPEHAVSIDMQRWLKVAAFLRDGKNPYVESSYLNAAPFWMQFIFVLDGLARATGLALLHLIQLFLIVVDLMTVTVLYHALSERGQGARALVLFGYALNPVSIVLTIQHGQFDILLGLIILAFVLSLSRYLERSEPIEWLYSTFWLGIGIWAKTVPFVLLPLVTLKLRTLRPRWLVFGGIQLVLPVTIALSVIYVLSPNDISTKVLGYVSVPGYFGISGLLGALASVEQFDALVKLCSQIFFALLLGSMVFVTAFIREREESLSYAKILLLAALLLISLPALGPGYGPQYISWFLPLLLLLIPEVSILLRRLFTIFLVLAAVTYSFEYLMLSTHGALLLSFMPDMKASFIELREPVNQTWLRIPLFLSYLSLLVVGWREVIRKN